MIQEPVLILADPMGNSWDFASRICNKLCSNVERKRDYVLMPVEIKRFRDGEIFVRILGNVRHKTCYFIHDSSMPAQDWLVSLGLVNDALMRSSANKICNVLPYMKFSRQDRMSEPRTPISSSLVADLIQRNAYRVLTIDLHNPATTCAYKIPFDNLKASISMVDYLKKNYSGFLENAVVVAPDVGSAKRAESYAKKLNLSIALADKRREKAGEVAGMTLIGDVRGKNALLVDDMIDSGKTLIKAAEVLKANGAGRIMACITHGIFSCGTEIFEGNNFEKIIVTDSIPQKSRGKIEVVSLVDVFSEAIFRISHGMSISEMYEMK